MNKISRKKRKEYMEDVSGRFFLDVNDDGTWNKHHGQEYAYIIFIPELGGKDAEFKDIYASVPCPGGLYATAEVSVGANDRERRRAIKKANNALYDIVCGLLDSWYNQKIV